AIVGIGHVGFTPESHQYSWKELMFEAAVRAYEDAHVDPRQEVDSFVTCAEDYWEGFSIADEFFPDPIGSVLRPMHTVCGDGIYGLANAFMQIKAGLFHVVAVEAHSKASDLLSYEGVLTHAFDPIYGRPLDGHPYFLAGLEMSAFLGDRENTEVDCAEVVRKNRGNALRNEDASFGEEVSVEEVMGSEPLFRPLKAAEISPLADGSIIVVLASKERARELTDRPVWVKGIGWASDSPSLETRELRDALYARLAARQAYEMAGVERPRRQIQVAEVDDRFSYKELQHIEALALAGGYRAGQLLREGYYEASGSLPVNPSGGSLGAGNLLEASGLFRVMEVVRQIRGEAGEHQVRDVHLGVAQSWRGVPTTSGGAVVLEG
ncbi:MAG: acetyl-CoA acetyltransferase, partial [Thermoplasmata archaeon]